MATNSNGSQSDIKKNLLDIFKAAGILCSMGLGVAVLFLVFWWDESCDHPFTEYAPTEIIQSCVLAASIVLFWGQARLRPGMRKALILVCGLLGCMLIREQDYFLDMVTHGFWKWPAFALAAACIAYALATPAATIASMAKLSRDRCIFSLFMGLVIVLAYSRILGTGILWKTLLPGENWRIAKYAVEESSELLGYLIILFSAFLLRGSKALPHDDGK